MSMIRVNLLSSWRRSLILPHCTTRASPSVLRVVNFSNSAERYVENSTEDDFRISERIMAPSSSAKNNSSLSAVPQGVMTALSNRNGEELHSAVSGLDRLGGLDSRTLESCIIQCLEAQDVANATILLALATPRNLNITVETCTALLEANITNFRWHLAAETLCHMIERDYEIKGRNVYSTFGGLMKDPKGVAAALKLSVLINVHKRGDLATTFSFSKVST